MEYFFNRVKDKCHLSICMSPVGESFRNYCRMFPALINNTTINWFMRWPEDALQEVAEKFLGEIELPEEHLAGLATICSYAHIIAIEKSDIMRQELKRIFYVTPTNYIELLKSYSVILANTRKVIGKQRDKLSNGLNKLDEARALVEDMNVMSEVKRVDVQKKTKGAEELVLEISKEQRNADERLKIIKQQQVIIERETEETERLANEAKEELGKALPALEAANDALA